MWFRIRRAPQPEIPHDLLPELQSVSRQLAVTLDALREFERRLQTIADATGGEEHGREP